MIIYKQLWPNRLPLVRQFTNTRVNFSEIKSVDLTFYIIEKLNSVFFQTRMENYLELYTRVYCYIMYLLQLFYNSFT